jgi:hypothetical protein
MITLTTPYQVSVGGVSVEDDTNGACMSYAMDFATKILTVVFKKGTLGGSPLNVVPGFYAQQDGTGTITVAVYVGPTQNGLTQYQWWLNGNLQPNLVPSASISPFVTQLLGDRNTAESFVAVAGGLMPGTTTPWSSI